MPPVTVISCESAAQQDESLLLTAGRHHTVQSNEVQAASSWGHWPAQKHMER